jgi:hypothetical protein
MQGTTSVVPSCSSLFLLLLALAAVQPAASFPWTLHTPWPWPDPSHRWPAANDTAWWRTLEDLWDHSRDKAAFCVGENQNRMLSLLALSFQWPLPVGPPEDSICRSNATIDTYLCGLDEITSYYQVPVWLGPVLFIYCCFLIIIIIIIIIVTIVVF